MEFIIKGGKIGFREKNKPGTIIDIDECIICKPMINELLREARSFLYKKNLPALRQIVIRSADESSISFVLKESSKTEEMIDQIKEFQTTAENVLITFANEEAYSEDYIVLKGKDKLKASYLGKEFLFPVQGFFQNNDTVAEKMHEYVNSLLKAYDTKDHALLDLYGGVGTFAAINQNLFNKVIVVESYKPGIELAKTNVKGADIYETDASRLKKVPLPEKLIVITDPPRSGMAMETIQELKRLKPKVIIYISCNQFQLKKDLKKFDEYTLKSTALFDMFPNTNHMEVVAELVKLTLSNNKNSNIY